MKNKFKVGDEILCIKTSTGKSYTKGTVYKVKLIRDYQPGLCDVFTETDNKGSNTNGWINDKFILNTKLSKLLYYEKE